MAVAQLVCELGRAKREGTLDRVFADILKARLLILDEFGSTSTGQGCSSRSYRKATRGGASSSR
ncbi:ATP-binding protein [Atopobium sp. oral taxon 416]|uniref:ATP-binding protein n=1 Tax=Atopobium sp. oral taxon 416 TaxID=712157 RepID=UPI002012308D|nr:ATP-binding protein [Atopobium sp. oral taxon 416]